MAAQVTEKICRLGRIALLRFIVGYQLLLARRRFPYRHNSTADGRMPLQDGLDFARLNPKAADLHLPISTSNELDVAVRQVFHDIAGAIQARAWSAAKRIRHESFAGSSPFGSGNLRRVRLLRDRAPRALPRARGCRAGRGCRLLCSRSACRLGLSWRPPAIPSLHSMSQRLCTPWAHKHGGVALAGRS